MSTDGIAVDANVLVYALYRTLLSMLSATHTVDSSSAPGYDSVQEVGISDFREMNHHEYR